jgi:hypothetical protein
MKSSSSLCCLLIPILLLGTLCAQEQIQPPVLEKQVEPDYPADLKLFLIEPTRVEMVVNQEGIPFSLKSATGLTDNVVQALAKWRFRPARKNGAFVASAVTIFVPIHRPIEVMMGRMVRFWSTSKDMMEAFAAAKDLDVGKAAKLEEDLTGNPENLKARLTLLAYATAAPSSEATQMRLRQILWLAKNMPKAEILGTPSSVPNPPMSPDAALYEQIRQIWLTQLAQNSKDPEILDHATNFLRFSDPEVVEKAAQQVIVESDRATFFLGDLYRIAILGVTAVDAVTGRPSNAGQQLPTTPFAMKARSVLAKTEDLNLLFSTLSAVSSAGPSLAKAGHLPAGYAGLCEELLARAKNYYAETRLTCDTAQPPPDPTPPLPRVPTRIRVGGNVQAANIVKKVSPAYPPEAKSRGITGNVDFLAVISKDGLIQSLTLLDGPLALYKSACDSVLRWEYRPTKLNGNPVEVVTQIRVNYTLN